MRAVFDTGIIQGCPIGEEEIAQVRALLSAHPQWSSWRISRHLALLWDWRSATGQLKDMAARTLLLKLQERGWITLPARRRASPNRMGRKHRTESEMGEDLFSEQARAEVRVAFPELRPLCLEEISRKKRNYSGQQS